MKNNLQKKLYEQGYLIVKNILNFKKDLKPVLNDMEFVMDCLIQKYARKKNIQKILNLNFKKKYSYVSKLNIHDLDQYFNTRLPRDHVKPESDYFATQSLWNLITNKNILDVVEKILGKEIMSNPVQNTRIKQPEKKLPKSSVHDGLSGRTPWHQDAAVLNSKGQKLTEMVTVWIPFTKTTKKNGCMITVKEINKMGLLNHVPGYRGQVELKNSKLLDKMKHVPLEADVGDIILLHKHSIHSSVKAAVCGLKKTFLFFKRGLFLAGGSVSNTSKPAPKIKFSFKALSKSTSFTIPPLAALIIMQFFFIDLSNS